MTMKNKAHIIILQEGVEPVLPDCSKCWGTNKVWEGGKVPAGCASDDYNNSCRMIACTEPHCNNGKIGRVVDGEQTLNALKTAYRKHNLNDDSIGWDELDRILLDALCEILTDNGYQSWLKEVSNESG